MGPTLPPTGHEVVEIVEDQTFLPPLRRSNVVEPPAGHGLGLVQVASELNISNDQGSNRTDQRGRKLGDKVNLTIGIYVLVVLVVVFVGLWIAQM